MKIARGHPDTEYRHIRVATTEVSAGAGPGGADFNQHGDCESKRVNRMFHVEHVYWILVLGQGKGVAAVRAGGKPWESRGGDIRKFRFGNELVNNTPNKSAG